MIQKETLVEPGSAVSVRPVLESEIDGVRTTALRLAPGQIESFDPASDSGRIFLFVKNAGVIRIDARTWRISEPALFISRPDQVVLIESTGCDPLLGLALDMNLTDAEYRAWADRSEARFPFFATYSECKTYREKIKSSKTVNRTLLPTRVYPRLCIGSVETDGPDHVAAHRHPMLEQYFLGLPDNRCRVRADADTVDFGPNDLLHIPLGSNHSVDVDAGRHLRYVWIDVFRDENGMRWIDEEHEDEP